MKILSFRHFTSVKGQEYDRPHLKLNSFRFLEVLIVSRDSIRMQLTVDLCFSLEKDINSEL